MDENIQDNHKFLYGQETAIKIICRRSYPPIERYEDGSPEPNPKLAALQAWRLK
jgi:hypothetical protein